MKNTGMMQCILRTRRFIRNLPLRKRPVPLFEKRLDVAIIGAPNAGKSVLLNVLLNSKLAATSRKKHTTRMEILGVFNHRNVQLVFFDTPGFLGIKQAEGHRDSLALRNLTASSVDKSDIVLLVVDASRHMSRSFLDLFAEMVRLALAKAKQEIILVLNKVDLVTPKAELLTITRKLVSLINGVKLGPERAHEAALDTTTFMISAMQDDGVIDLKNYLIASAPPKSWLLSKDSGITDMEEDQRVEQIVLEMLLDHTHDEVPYEADIHCRSIQPMGFLQLRIDVDIIVQNHGQQRIVVGQQGRTLVKIRQSAVPMLEEIFEKKVMLFLWVKTAGSPEHEDVDTITAQNAPIDHLK